MYMCVCVCVCVCVSVCLSVCLTVAERRAYTNRPISFKFDIWGPLANISSLFLFFPLPLKLRVANDKIFKISIK